MRKIALFLLLILFIGLETITAQTKDITGKVVDNLGEAIPGVSIVVKGTTIGTVTRFDGTYALSVPSDATNLVFTFVGMESQDVLISGQSSINVTLKSDTKDIDEVMVVAYGTSTKRSFTGTAEKVSAERIESKNVSNISQALQGEIAGVQVIGDNGQPGSAAKIRIRGIGSINGSKDPLYVVDGMPLQGDINSISPADVASTTVLKDASATAIYGSRGANGVVMITTKRGKKGKSSIEVDFKQGINMRLLSDYDVYTNPEEYVETAWSALKTRGLVSGYSEADAVDYANTRLFNSNVGFDSNYNMWDQEGSLLIDSTTGKFNTNVKRRYSPKKWSDEMFQSAKRTELGARISGGNDKTDFYSSFGFLDDQGYYLNSDYERFTGRLNVNHQVKSWLKGSMNMSYMNSESNFAGGQDDDSNNGFWLVSNMPPIYPVYARDEEGNEIDDKVLGGSVFDFGDGTYGTRRFASLSNAVATSTYDIVRTINNQFSGTSKLEATFLKDFVLSSTFGIEYLNSNYDKLGNAFYGGSANEVGGTIYKRKRQYFAFSTTNMLKYHKQIDNHNIDAFVAQEASKLEFKELAASKSGLADPWSTELNNAVVSSPSTSYTDEYLIESYFGQISYDFDSKYFFNGVIRGDGSSKFVNDKWGTFWSIGGAWMVSKESFMDGTSRFLNELKLKASYGKIGEQGGVITGDKKGFGPYDGRTLFEVSNLNDKLSLTEYHVGNSSLTWEESKQWQLGTEFRLFNRVDGSVDYYSKNTDNLLFDKRVAPSHGYAIIQVNDAKMRNSGLEVVLNTEIINKGDFSLDFGINAAFEDNEITEMPIEEGTGKQKVIDVSTIYGRSVGHSLYDIYTREFAGVNSDNGLSMWSMYFDDSDNNGVYQEGVDKKITSMELFVAENPNATVAKTTTTKYADATQKYINKSPIPKVRGSFNLKADYKGLSLTALFSYSLGGYGYDYNYVNLMSDGLLGSNNWHKDIADAWKKPGDITDIPAITGGLTNGADSNYGLADSQSDRFVTKTDYLALNNVVLSYNFNKHLLDKLKLKGLKVFVSGDNLWVGTKRKGFYPNTSEVGASSRYQYVALTSFTGGINVKF